MKKSKKSRKPKPQTTRTINARFESGLFRADLDGVLFVAPTVEVLERTISNITGKPVKATFALSVGETDECSR